MLRWWRRFVNETILPSEQEAIDSFLQLLVDTEASLQKYEVTNDLIRLKRLERQHLFCRYTLITGVGFPGMAC